MHEQQQMDKIMRRADWWLCATGNSFLHTYWNTTDSGNLLVPYEQCQACKVVFAPSELMGRIDCPKCGSPSFSTATDPATGQPIGLPVVEGKGGTEALSPFEIAVPLHVTDFDETPYVIRLRWRPKKYYEDHYGKDISKQLPYDKMPSERSLQLLKSINTQSDVSATPLTWGISATHSDGLAEYELWMKPCKKYPEGLLLKVAGDGSQATVLHDDTAPGPLPFFTKQGEAIFPFIHVRFQPFGGRLWARGPLDPIIQKNDQLNQLDSLTQMIVQRVANPVWLEPKGTEVKQFTGEPGVVVKYQPISIAGASKPERLSGENIPPTLFQLREQYLQDIEVLSGTYDVTKGAKPAGVEAFSSLQLLVERSQSRFSTVFNERGEAYRKWFLQAVELERQFGPTERMFAITKPNQGFTFRHFQNADLQGAVQIRVEDGSQAPKTNLGKRAAIEQANNLRIINPTDPEQTYAIMSHFGLQDLMPSLDTDVKAALGEQDMFEAMLGDENFATMVYPQIEMAVQQHQMAMQQYQVVAQAQQQQNAINATFGMPEDAIEPPPTLPDLTPFKWRKYHRHEVHHAEHRKWANSDAARVIFEQYPALEFIVQAHLDQHEEILMQQAMQQAAAQAPPQKQSPGGRAMQNSNNETGDTNEPKGNGQRADNRGPE
jgi:hypothetical protein